MKATTSFTYLRSRYSCSHALRFRRKRLHGPADVSPPSYSVCTPSEMGHNLLHNAWREADRCRASARLRRTSNRHCERSHVYHCGRARKHLTRVLRWAGADSGYRQRVPIRRIATKSIFGNWRNLARSGAHLVVQEVVKRESLGAIPYGPDEHRLNLYIGGNLQAINEFIKRDSELAAFYKQEAEPVSLPLFGPNRNLTVEGRLYRDPHAASVLKISRANEIGSGLRVPETDAAPQATWTVRRIPATTPQWGFLVKIKTATPCAKLRYTLDGSPLTPPNNGIVLQPPLPWGPWHVTITPPTKSKARAYKKCFRDPYVVSRTYP